MHSRREVLSAMGVLTLLAVWSRTPAILHGQQRKRGRAAVDPNATINSVDISFWSINDDKDEEEKVEVWIEQQNGTVLANAGYGEGEKWDEEEDGGKLVGPFRLNLSSKPKISESGRLRIRVKKHPHGSATGAGWSMAVAVVGHLSEGSDANLLTRTEETRIGDGNPIERTWNFQSVG